MLFRVNQHSAREYLTKDVMELRINQRLIKLHSEVY